MSWALAPLPRPLSTRSRTHKCSPHRKASGCLRVPGVGSPAPVLLIIRTFLYSMSRPSQLSKDGVYSSFLGLAFYFLYFSSWHFKNCLLTRLVVACFTTLKIYFSLSLLFCMDTYESQIQKTPFEHFYHYWKCVVIVHFMGHFKLSQWKPALKQLITDFSEKC